MSEKDKHDCTNNQIFKQSKNPLLDAQVATPCGHSFCGWCVHILKSKNAGRGIICETCGGPIAGWCKNLLANNFLSIVEGDCKWCGKKFTLNTAKDHIEKCQEMEVPCKQCKTVVKRKEEGAHSANCSMADVLCPCGLTFKRADEESHIQTMCCLKEVPCPLKCGKDVKRYLIPSHTMDCGKAVTVCDVRGCEQTVRRVEMDEHIAKNQMRHFSLMNKDRQNLLWNILQGVKQNVKPKGTGMVTAVRWELPPVIEKSVVCSPSFNKWERNWRFLCDTDGKTYLHYCLGVDPVHLTVSCVVETGHKAAITVIPLAKLAEGQMLSLCKIPAGVTAIIVKLEVMEAELID